MVPYNNSIEFEDAWNSGRREMAEGCRFIRPSPMPGLQTEKKCWLCIHMDMTQPLNVLQ